MTSFDWRFWHVVWDCVIMELELWNELGWMVLGEIPTIP